MEVFCPSAWKKTSEILVSLSVLVVCYTFFCIMRGDEFDYHSWCNDNHDQRGVDDDGGMDPAAVGHSRSVKLPFEMLLLLS